MLRSARPKPNEIIRTLAPLPWVAAQHPLLRSLEDRCTPQEFADAFPRIGILPGRTQQTIRELGIKKLLETEKPEPYRQYDVRPDVSLYSNPLVPPGGKCLLFIFGGGSHRPMIPRVEFVQCLPADRYDICFIKDPKRVSFENGVAGYAHNLQELAVSIRRDLNVEQYRKTATFGVSIAGLSALRFGILVGSERAISVGGRWNWHVGRLLRRKSTVPAFDLLCECGPRGSTRLIYVYGALNAEDPEHVKRLQLTHSVEIRIVPDCDHNFVRVFVADGRLRQYLAEIFESGPEIPN